MSQRQRIRWLKDLTNDDVAEVGGKNASLGEMIGALRRLHRASRSSALRRSRFG